ncbi:MAG: class I SAM-dependent methyltransferase [Aquabacterium sp.]|uniref:class I SAM-dependent methyltransferase n=1 Tax=Aquabacterium sp. TaxID=1872578 RepID=UPI002715AC60|nr:class I SAM-dependent methyltransferase [Aquabacterium sp.]MDO9005054.1 class I SAM-dependent methyltransferase [Aquabacterium sp.]
MTPFQALLDAIATIELPTEAQRVFHGRGGLFPGCEQWSLDYFTPVWLLTSFEPVSDEDLAPIQAALAQRWDQIAPGQPLNLVLQTRDDARAETRLLAGEVPDPHVVSAQGAVYRVHLLRGLNHGLFLDMAEGRRWVHEHIAARPGLKKVLNLFAYTCAFSIVALKAGARQVTNIDMSGGALSIGKQNHQLNGLTSGAHFLPHDIFSSWGTISRRGPYDLIILDPPSYQKGSFVAEKDYAKLMRRLPDLLAPDGHAVLCLNSPRHGAAFLQDQMKELAPELTFVERVDNPAVFADVSSDRALKVLVYKAPSL